MKQLEESRADGHWSSDNDRFTDSYKDNSNNNISYQHRHIQPIFIHIDTN